MLGKIFKSATNSFTLKYPFSWEYKIDPDAKGDTMMFFKKNEGMGTLRLTSMVISKKGMVKPIIEEYHKKIKSSRIYKRDDTFYLEYSETPKTDKDIEMYYWYIGKKDILIVLSFTILKFKKSNPKTISDLKTAKEIIKSVKINR